MAVALNLSEMYRYAIQYIVIILLLVAVEFLRKAALAHYIAQMTAELRKDFLDGYYRKSNRAIARHSSQDYISMFNHDIKTVAEDCYGLSVDITMSVLSIVVCSVALFLIRPLISLIAIAANMISILIPLMMKSTVNNSRQAYFHTMRTYNNKLSDAVRGHITVKLFHLENGMAALVQLASSKNLKDLVKYEYRKALVDVLVGLFSFISMFSIIFLGVYYISVGSISVGALFAAIQISELLTMPIINVSSDFSRLLSARKIRDGLNQAFEHDFCQACDVADSVALQTVSLNNVKVHKHDKTILRVDDLTIERGKKYLFYGANGSGKSTLLNVIAGIEDDYSGTVALNGLTEPRAARSFDFAYAPQSPFLFHDTLKSNITLNHTYDHGLLDELLNVLGIEELIAHKGHAVYTENDEKLSGGEKQKISLARVLLLQKDVLLLDEATSAMDRASSVNIETYLLSNPDLTLLYVAHKVYEETKNRFDCVIELSGP